MLGLDEGEITQVAFTSTYEVSILMLKILVLNQALRNNITSEPLVAKDTPYKELARQSTVFRRA